MANKIIFGSRPANFKPFPVKFELPDGTVRAINVTYKYRTKTEFGEMLDGLIANGKKADAQVLGEKGAAEKPEFSWEKFYAENIEAGAEQLMNSVVAWDLELEISKEIFVQMGDEAPAAVTALMASYASACREGRLGN